MPDDLARVVLEIVGDSPRDIVLEPEGSVSFWRHRSHVSPGFITITMRSDHSHPKLPPPHQFYIDLSGLRSQYYPYVENNPRELTHAWITRQSGITIAHGIATSESLNGYGQRLPSDDVLTFTPGMTIAGVLVTPGYEASLQLIRSLGSGFDHRSFARDGNSWRMGRFAPPHETVSLSAIYR